jgi:hypothetical protein
VEFLRISEITSLKTAKSMKSFSFSLNFDMV